MSSVALKTDQVDEGELVLLCFLPLAFSRSFLSFAGRTLSQALLCLAWVILSPPGVHIQGRVRPPGRPLLIHRDPQIAQQFFNHGF